MAIEVINVGSSAGDGTGDVLRTAFTKSNDNFAELSTLISAKLSPNGNGSSLTGLTKSQVGLGNVDNTSDANKPISSATQTALDGKQAAGTYATLSGGKVPVSQLPAIAITSTSVVVDETAMLALTAQEGDVAVRTDLSKSFIHNGGTSGTTADWQELLAPAGGVSSVNSMTGAVTITKSTVGLGNVDNTSDLNKPISTATQTALDGKQGLDTQLTDLAALSYSSNGLKVIRVNSGATAFELITLAKGDVGLGNVDNTSDANKPISTATQTALDLKATVTSVDLKADKTATLNLQTGTTYTIQTTDNGLIVDCSNTGSITVTLPNSMPVGYSVVVLQANTGQITFSAEAGASIRHRESHTKTAGRWSAASLYVRSNSGGTSAEWILMGDTTT